MEKMKPPTQNIKLGAEKFKYCPTCKGELKKREDCDVLISGLGCTNNHRFFVPLELVRPPAHRGEFLKLTSNRSGRDEIAKDWLTDTDLRRHLNNQVAEVLRIFLEVRDSKYDSAKQNEASKKGALKRFCPKCGESVKSVGGDGYSVDYRCTNDHKFSERGYRLTFLHDEQFADGGYLQLCLDIDYGTLRGLTQSFTTSKEEEKFIAPQVLGILKQYADEFLKDDPNTAPS
jgi:predicted RNA-binding Zn-ribbon protein involved in translation (DUF1610 family)